MTNGKIKVVYGINDFLIGGVQRQFVEQLRFFDGNRFEIILITLFEFPDQADLYDQLPSTLEVHRLNFTSIRDIHSWRELHRLLVDIKPDIAVSNLFFANTVFRMLKPLLGYHVIACEHNTYTDKSFLERLTDRVLSAVSYRIVAVSATVATFTAHQEGIRKEKFAVFPNGIDVHTWRHELEGIPSKEVLKQELGFRPSDYVVLTVARLMPQKNHRLLLDGFALFHQKNPASVLALVGDGPLRHALESQAETLGIKKAVMFFGMRRDVSRFYKASDVFVLTSDIEGFALVCIEAMVAGLPVVSTATAGPDEYIQNGMNGFLVRNARPEGIAEGIQKVVDAEQGILQKRAQETAAQYDIASSVRLYEQLFEDALKA